MPMLKAGKKSLLFMLQRAEEFIVSRRKRKYRNSEMIPWTKGYSEYKYDYIGDFVNGEKLSAFVRQVLPERYGYRLDERVVEYPWFFSRLKDTETVVLDAGSVLNFRQFLTSKRLQERHLYISTLHYEGRPEIVPSPSYIYEDLRDMCYRDEFFDAVCCLSTLEHVGLDNTFLYTPDQSKKENDKYSYLKATEEFRRVLKPGGTLYLSVPYGRYKDHGWLQVFDREMVERIEAVFGPGNVKKTFFRYDNDQWNFSDEIACEDGYIFDIHNDKVYEKDYLAFARCVVCLEIRKPKKHHRDAIGS